MFFNFIIYKLILLDYFLALYIILPVILYNKNFQKIDIKILNFFLWIIAGLPVFFVFFFKMNFFLENLLLIFFFFFLNTGLLLLYYENIKIVLKKKKNYKYFYNN